MPRRRSFGHVFRRRRTVKDAEGAPRTEFRPGFYVRLRVGGREVVRYGGVDRETAIAYAHRLTRDVDRRDLLGEQPGCEILFENFAETFLEFAKQHLTESSFQSRQTLVRNQLVPAFRGSVLGDIDAPDIQNFLLSKTTAAGATRNRLLSGISAIFRRAIDLGLVTKNPAREVRRSREPRFPLTLVPDARVAELLGRIQEPQRTFFTMLADSGLRLAEGMRLEWPDIDFEQSTLHIRVTKAQRPRLVAMTARLRTALQSHYQLRTLSIAGPPRVFPQAMTRHTNLRKFWRMMFKKAAREIGVPKLRVHDLRHLYAIALVRRGIDLPTVQAVLGHTSLLSTLRYAEYMDGSAPFRAARALDESRAVVGGPAGPAGQ